MAYTNYTQPFFSFFFISLFLRYRGLGFIFTPKIYYINTKNSTMSARDRNRQAQEPVRVRLRTVYGCSQQPMNVLTHFAQDFKNLKPIVLKSIYFLTRRAAG